MTNTKEKVNEILDNQEEKAFRYGNVDLKMNQMMQILYPDGIPVCNYAEGLYVLHVLEKMARITNPNIDDSAKFDAKKDIIGYTILEIEKDY